VTSRRGRSPRARGNHGVELGQERPGGSIPAGAGKPSPEPSSRSLNRVDPRGRGETSTRSTIKAELLGRSPRARGNRTPGCPSSPLLGSILAGAGKPPLNERAATLDRVDPRGRGETSDGVVEACYPPGRSPRARGNPGTSRSPAPEERSIPAGAGKPPACRRRCWPQRVDPRGRGETKTMPAARVDFPGRSPRARGNHHQVRRQRVELGSIPAGAGKPDPRRRARCPRRVDPRGRGETARTLRDLAEIGGRSPRARGNPPGLPRLALHHGSIPAGAGKPTTRSSTVPSRRVDPRGRGETIGCSSGS